MLDHPVTQKLIVAVAGGTFLAIGGTAWQSNLRLERHDEQLKAIAEKQKTLDNHLLIKLETIGGDTSEIKRDVAVLVERTDNLEQRQDADEREHRESGR